MRVEGEKSGIIRQLTWGGLRDKSISPIWYKMKNHSYRCRRELEVSVIEENLTGKCEKNNRARSDEERGITKRYMNKKKKNSSKAYIHWRAQISFQ